MIQNPHRLITKMPLRRVLLRPLYSGKEAAPPQAKEENDGGGGVISREEAYREIQNLDFMKATKILFTSPPKKKKFGFDFHLVQFFFACMPSLAVFLVAQYARHEIRRMEAEAENGGFACRKGQNILSLVRTKVNLAEESVAEEALWYLKRLKTFFSEFASMNKVSRS